MTFSGHDHKYERTCPVYKKACLDLDANGSATAPVHVVSGNAGFRLSWGYNPHTPPYWEAMALEHGYLRCEANNTFLGCEVRPGLDASTRHLHSIKWCSSITFTSLQSRSCGVD